MSKDGVRGVPVSQKETAFLMSSKRNQKERDFVIRPFEKLSELLPGKRGSKSCGLYVGKPSGPVVDDLPRADSGPGEFERRLFEKAMAGVVPLSSARDKAEGTRVCPDSRSGLSVSGPPAGGMPAGDRDAYRELSALVRGEMPINISQTPEYVEGSRSREGAVIARKLHRGAFAVQAYCDLHGMDSIEALEMCEEFVSNALREGKRCIAFIHGRGLSSRGRPVLKRLVIDWLSRGPYRKRVVAFASAPAWDGGAGVTYVLLRGRLSASRVRR